MAKRTFRDTKKKETFQSNDKGLKFKSNPTLSKEKTLNWQVEVSYVYYYFDKYIEILQIVLWPISC